MVRNKEKNVTPKPETETKSKSLMVSSLFQGDITLVSEEFRSKLIMAEVLAKSQAIPIHFIGKPAAVFSAVQWGKELGVSEMTALNNMYNISGKTAVSTVLLYGLVARRKDFRGMVRKPAKTRGECVVVVRRAFPGEDGKEEILEYEGKFTHEDAKQADLLKKEVWNKYEERMLFNRALAFALRDGFPDALAGLYTYEELKPDISVREMEDTTL